MKVFSIVRYIHDRALNISAKGIFLAIFQSKKSLVKQSQFLFVCHDNSRSLIIDQKLYAPIVDPIISDVGIQNTVTFAMPFSKYFGKACYGNTIIYSRILLIAYFKRFFSKNINLKNYQDDPLVKAWLRILNIVKPHFVIGINPSVELCLAAKKLEIISIDVQHGILATYNYYGIHKRESLGQKGWPDYIFCWDDFSKNFVLNNVPPFVKPIITGNPAYVSSFFNELIDSKGKYLASLAHKKIVLITLDSLCPPEMADDFTYKTIGIPFGIIKFIKQHGSNYKWFIRLHPAQMKNKKKEIYKELGCLFSEYDNVSWDMSSSIPLIVLMKYVKLHITYNSATTREASLFNIKTIILDQNEKNIKSYFGELLEDHIVKIIHPLNHFKISQSMDEMIKKDGDMNVDKLEFHGNYKKVIAILRESATFDNVVHFKKKVSCDNEYNFGYINEKNR